MAYDNAKGNFYHDEKDQIIEKASLEECTLVNCAMDAAVVGPIEILAGEDAPDAELLAPAGSIYIQSVAAGSSKMYFNVGTDSVPSWKQVTVAS